MRFAIADLDGDRKPDLASVESETQQAGGTSYAIRVQSSTGADSHIGVLGPVGGMRLALRDVNGDKNLDLVLTSVINHRVIQVLLNDGRGNFSPAEADQNVAAPAEVEQSWSNREPSREDGAGSTNSRWSFDRGSFGITIADPKPDLSSGKSELTARAWGHARLRQGRAPPNRTQQS